MSVLSSPRASHPLKRLQIAVFLSLLYIWAGTAAAEKIDVNTAPLEKLVKIIHIGETRAGELIFLRPFSSLDELTGIKGIGEARLLDIKKQGLAWVASQLPESEQEQPIGPDSEKIGEEQIYPTAAIRINEILPSPEGFDETEEWIEIFNQDDFEVDLFKWQITDIAGQTTTYTFPEETKISAQGFLVLGRPESKIILNNDGDGLNLIEPDGRIIDSISYEKAPRGQSYNYQEAGWFWSSGLTPGSANIMPVPISGTEKKDKKAVPLEKSEEVLIDEPLMIYDIRNENFPKPFSPLSIASVLAVSSGISILVLKRKIKKNLTN
ncbi:MAG TPA: lamin tail domain-containing protein [Patescibacteria group bacterium]|nr:lamin tail domain-containing protein [Patescibacteria group bacterium]